MEAVIAKLSQEAMILFCLLFSPPGEKAVLIDLIGKEGVAAELTAMRTDTGFEVFEVVDLTGRAGEAQRRRILTIVAVKGKPSVFEITDRRNRKTRLDLTKAVKAIKPLKEARIQIIRINGGKATVIARGNIVYVYFRDTSQTFVVHTVAPRPRATTQPATQPAPAASDDAKEAVARAKGFWAVLAKGDTDAMKSYYAPKVTLKAGSELLKKRWGSMGDRSKDAVVERAKLIDGYKSMIADIGRQRWSEGLSAIPVTSPSAIKFAVADKPGTLFPEVQKGDLIMKVGGDEGLIFVLRKNKKEEWLIVIERTDY